MKLIQLLWREDSMKLKRDLMEYLDRLEEKKVIQFWEMKEDTSRDGSYMIKLRISQDIANIGVVVDVPKFRSAEVGLTWFKRKLKREVMNHIESDLNGMLEV